MGKIFYTPKQKREKDREREGGGEDNRPQSFENEYPEKSARETARETSIA
jgi:hypothetical protein